MRPLRNAQLVVQAQFCRSLDKVGVVEAEGKLEDGATKAVHQNKYENSQESESMDVDYVEQQLKG